MSTEATTLSSASSLETSSVTGKRKLDTTEDPVPQTKKARAQATIVRVQDLDLTTDMECGSVNKANMCTLIPITNTSKKALYFQLSGGGDIPIQFGLGEMPDNPDKFKLTFNIASDEEYDSLDTIRSQLSTVAIQKWKSWFPSVKTCPSDVLLQDLCYRLVTEKKERNGNPGQFYPGLMKATFDINDIESKRCRIVHGDTKEQVSFRDLPGMRWSRAIIEMRHIFIQGSKSYGLTKRLRYIEVLDGHGEEEIVPLD